jgi:hypothetical protein
LNGVVITGPYLRSCLVNINFENDKNSNISVRNEVYIFRYRKEKWNDLIENFDDYIEKDNEYVLEKEDKKICLIKKKYTSTSQIILQHEYMKRIGWEAGSFYVSSMFLIEYQKHRHTILSKICDPILNIPYDPLGIFYIKENNNKNILKIIDSVDLEELMKIPEKNITKFYGSKTLIEICVDKYMKEKNILLMEELEKMIVYLMHFSFKRPISFYAKIVDLHKKNEVLHQFICDNDTCLQLDDIDDMNFNSIEDINNIIIEHFIQKDEAMLLMEFICSIHKKIDKKMLDKIIKYKSKNIMKDFIENEIINEYMTYYLILLSNEIYDLVELIKINMETAINFLKDIITNGIYASFKYLVENDNSILSTMFEEDRNIFHLIKMEGEFEKIIEKIIEICPDLINVSDSNGETPIIYHAKKNPKIIDYFLKYENIIDLTITDNNGNTCLHHLCKYDEPKILKTIIKKYPELVNMPNSKSEYPILICCKNKLENMFYLLKKYGADLNITDEYGNTIYHYICSNSMCLGLEIKNISNFFGATPKEYCQLAHKYYNFSDDNISICSSKSTKAITI